jgi:hypothetical protein
MSTIDKEHKWPWPHGNWVKLIYQGGRLADELQASDQFTCVHLIKVEKARVRYDQGTKKSSTPLKN